MSALRCIRCGDPVGAGEACAKCGCITYGASAVDVRASADRNADRWLAGEIGLYEAVRATYAEATAEAAAAVIRDRLSSQPARTTPNATETPRSEAPCETNPNTETTR